MRSLFYLASPYFHEKPEVRHARAHAVARIAGHLLKRGIHVFSPIAHGHTIDFQHEGGIGWDSSQWLAYDEIYLKICCGIFVAEIPRWQESKGVDWEIDWAKANNLVVTHIPEKQCMGWVGPTLWEACNG